MSRIWVVLAVVAAVMVITKMMRARGNTVMANEKIRAGALVLDVRTPAEYQQRHYPQALNIPVQELESRLGELKDKKRAIVVYCASGMRSASAVGILQAAGFADVTNGGGLMNLESAR